MDKLLNADYWYKSYLLEFKQNGVLTDAFTFSVPPKSEEFVFPQRKSETKTFGGCVVADYGNDMVQINLSGNTINQELKLIFKSGLGMTYMTGSEEVFYLRDLLRKYGSEEHIQNKEVYLYSLNGSRIKNTRNNPKWWKVYIGELNINRNERAPFTYNYKLSCSGVPEVTRKFKWKWIETITSWLDKITELCNTALQFSNMLLEYTVAAIETLNGLIDSLNSAIDLLNSTVMSYINLLNSGMVLSAQAIKETVAIGDKVLFQKNEYYPTSLQENIWNAGQSVIDAGRSIGIELASWQKDSSGTADKDITSTSAWQNIKEFYGDDVDDQDIIDALCTVSQKLQSTTNEMFALISKNLNDNSVTVKPGEGDEDDQIIRTYGYKTVVVTDADTSWDHLSQKYYGDSSLGCLIANYNNLPIDQPLKGGMRIQIPNLNQQNSSSDNEIYNSPDVHDNYGYDIMLSDGDFGVRNNDYSVIGSYENLEQALRNRYTTILGARIRVEVYGIQSTIGDAARASTALIQASISQTTMEDPRINSVDNVDFAGKGDTLTVEVTYTDKNGATRTMGGQI